MLRAKRTVCGLR